MTAFLVALPPPVCQWNSVKPLAGMCVEPAVHMQGHMHTMYLEMVLLEQHVR